MSSNVIVGFFRPKNQKTANFEKIGNHDEKREFFEEKNVFIF